MSIRLALATIVLLIGLTSLHDLRSGGEPFTSGGATLVEEAGPLATIWRDERTKMVADDETVTACMRDGVPDCGTVRALLDIITEAKKHTPPGKALVGQINRSINLLIRPAPGAWIAPLEVLTLGGGDCKDYAIAKFFTLREAGIAPERLRLVVVFDRKSEDYHMVTAVNDGGQWLILDNQTMFLLTDTDAAKRYLPFFVLDNAGVRRYLAVGL